MIETLEYLQLFARFPLALHRFLRHTVTLDEARRTVRDRMQTRDARFPWISRPMNDVLKDIGRQ